MKLGVIFGGKSCEHDVSIITGIQLIQNVDKSKYDVVPIYVSRDGKFYTGEKLLDIEFLNSFDPSKVTQVSLSATSGIKAFTQVGSVQKKGLFGGGSSQPQTFPVDVVILAMHGLHGEDGTIQGLLELADIPYGNTGVMGSSVGMDKITMKAVFKSNGFPVMQDLALERNVYKKDQAGSIELINSQLKYPVFVKPANLGSSIGISKATDEASLKQALEVAFNYDRRVLVEQGVTDLMEVNCSCLGYSDDIQASVCEMPVSWQEFLGFEDKYLRGGKNSKGMESLSRKIPAPISEQMTSEIQQLSKNIFAALDCKGVVRIDYLIDKSQNKVYIGEINTQPGSFAYYLWEETGIKYPDLINKLVEERNKKRDKKEFKQF